MSTIHICTSFKTWLAPVAPKDYSCQVPMGEVKAVKPVSNGFRCVAWIFLLHTVRRWRTAKSGFINSLSLALIHGKLYSGVVNAALKHTSCFYGASEMFQLICPQKFTVHERLVCFAFSIPVHTGSASPMVSTSPYVGATFQWMQGLHVQRRV